VVATDPIWFISAMSFTVSFRIANPVASNTAFTFIYDVLNNGPDDTAGHLDHVQVWGSDGSKPFDSRISALPSAAGQSYETEVPMPALAAGYYDVSVTTPDGSAGSTIIVQ
jgi:hypothetical protein